MASLSHIVLFTLSKSKPRRHLVVLKIPSPFPSFLIEIGSMASSLLGGKTLCIPWRIPCATCSTCYFVVGMIHAMKLSKYTSRRYQSWPLSQLVELTVALLASAQCANLYSERAPIFVLIYFTKTSIAVLGATHLVQQGIVAPLVLVARRSKNSILALCGS